MYIPRRLENQLNKAFWIIQHKISSKLATHNFTAGEKGNSVNLVKIKMQVVSLVLNLFPITSNGTVRVIFRVQNHYLLLRTFTSLK